MSAEMSAERPQEAPDTMRVSRAWIEALEARLTQQRSASGELRGLLRALLHVADNGFMAPEVRTEQIRDIRERFAALDDEPESGKQSAPESAPESGEQG